MTDLEVLNPTTITMDINFDAIKADADLIGLTSPEKIRQMAEAARRGIVSIDFYDVYSTCMDERPRAGVVADASLIEPRPSDPGAANVYGLAVAELSGGFVAGSPLLASDRLHQTTIQLKGAKLKGGAHEDCAANNKLGIWLPLIADEKDDISKYVAGHIDNFDQAIMDRVINEAERVKEEGTYSEWTGEELGAELGDEAGKATEKLQPVAHLGKLMLFNYIDGTTVHQHLLGNTVFVLDIEHMRRVEEAVTVGPEAVAAARQATYARFAIIRALQLALPNKELYEVSFRR